MYPTIIFFFAILFTLAFISQTIRKIEHEYEYSGLIQRILIGIFWSWLYYLSH